MRPKTIVVYSGGMDSFTLLHRARQQYGEFIEAVSVLYGQRHARELTCAKAVTTELGIRHTIIDLSALRDVLSNSALTSDKPVPHGHYADKSMKQTVVPNRNMILLSVAIGVAVDRGAEEVWYGAHAGDHAVYPDCRPEFVNAMDRVARTANYSEVHVHAPYLYKSKADILEEGIGMGLDYLKTWTCYDPQGEKACGRCGSCTERLEAFDIVGRTDPLEYA